MNWTTLVLAAIPPLVGYATYRAYRAGVASEREFGDERVKFANAGMEHIIEMALLQQHHTLKRTTEMTRSCVDSLGAAIAVLEAQSEHSPIPDELDDLMRHGRRLITSINAELLPLEQAAKQPPPTVASR